MLEDMPGWVSGIDELIIPDCTVFKLRSACSLQILPLQPFNENRLRFSDKGPNRIWLDYDLRELSNRPGASSSVLLG
jgi:hypothetical protein